MIKIECMTPQEPSAMTKAVNDKIASLVSDGCEVLNVYPMTIGDSRYVSIVINYETNPQPTSQFVTMESLDGMLTTYAKKTDIPKVPTKVSQLTNDSKYITKSVADGLYEPKVTGV